MNKWILFLIIFLSSCSEYQGDKSSNNYDSVEIEFVGNSDEFYAKERLVLEITDSSIVSELNNLKNNSKSIWFGGFKAVNPVSFRTSYGQYNDIYIIGYDNYANDFYNRSNFVTKIYWSKSEGLIRYDKKDGVYWELIKMAKPL